MRLRGRQMPSPCGSRAAVASSAAFSSSAFPTSSALISGSALPRLGDRNLGGCDLGDRNLAPLRFARVSARRVDAERRFACEEERRVKRRVWEEGVRCVKRRGVGRGT